MPYISQNERDNIDAAFKQEMNSIAPAPSDPSYPRGRWDLVAATMSPGQLNYLITRFIKAYYDYSPNYQRANDVLGVLDATAREYYRRVVVPYEEKKREKNGDVY